MKIDICFFCAWWRDRRDRGMLQVFLEDNFIVRLYFYVFVQMIGVLAIYLANKASLGQSHFQCLSLDAKTETFSSRRRKDTGFSLVVLSQDAAAGVSLRVSSRTSSSSERDASRVLGLLLLLGLLGQAFLLLPPTLEPGADGLVEDLFEVLLGERATLDVRLAAEGGSQLLGLRLRHGHFFGLVQLDQGLHVLAEIRLRS